MAQMQVSDTKEFEMLCPNHAKKLGILKSIPPQQNYILHAEYIDQTIETLREYAWKIIDQRKIN